jgi:hypothetical protein
MSDSVKNAAGGNPADGAGKFYAFTITHNFTTDPCLSANTISYLLPPDILLLTGACKNHAVGTTANLAIGVTGNTDYVVAAKAMQTIADWVIAADNDTPQVLAGATNYIVLNPDADMIAGRITATILYAKLPDID